MQFSSARFWGPLSRLGFIVLVLTFLIDQVSKWWVLRVVNLDERPPLQLTSFAELAMAWNKGVSYGLLSTHMQEVLIALSLVISAVLWIWLARTHVRLVAVALGLIIGGALGNSLDRGLHGAVADFVHLHWGNWSWYIFNVADIAIVAGVALMLYDGLIGKKAV